jgi:hypothetical protein
MTPREELKRFLQLFNYFNFGSSLIPRKGPAVPAAVNPKRRAERADMKVRGIKSMKTYRRIKKVERRIERQAA